MGDRSGRAARPIVSLSKKDASDVPTPTVSKVNAHGRATLINITHSNRIAQRVLRQGA
jgi:hypothetical protein